MSELVSLERVEDIEEVEHLRRTLEALLSPPFLHISGAAFCGW